MEETKALVEKSCLKTYPWKCRHIWKDDGKGIIVSFCDDGYGPLVHLLGIY
jgi:hypothetical protein